MRKFSELVNAISQQGSTVLLYSPDIDSVIATSILYRFLITRDIDVEAINLFSSREIIDRQSVVVLIGVKQKRALSTYRVLYLDDFIGRDPRSETSISLHLVKALSERWVVRKDEELLAIASMLTLSHGSMYDEDLIEAHMKFIEDASSRGIVELYDTMRFFGYPNIDLYEAIYRTLEPYIDGITMNRQGIEGLLKDLGIAVKGSLSEEVKEKILSTISSIVSRYSRKSIPLVGKKLVSKLLRGPIYDLYELAYTLLMLLDSKGPEYLCTLSFGSEILNLLYPCALNTLDSLVGVLSKIVNGEIDVKRFTLRMNRVSVIELESRAPFNTLYRALRALGIVERLAVFRTEDGFVVPYLLAEQLWPIDEEVQTIEGGIVVRNLDDVSKYLRGSRL